MIAIDRRTVAVPSALDGANSKGEVELRKAEAFFALAVNKEKSYPFKIYKDPTVKDALRQLFQGKCAYCESFLARTQPPDVEHFRPKGGFISDTGKLSKPGYWWLAATWENLLPSCIDCNRKRQHKIDGEQESFGKENLFPVGGLRAGAPNDDLLAEACLLIDPCSEDPQLFFRYIEEGVMVRKPGIHARKRLMVEASMKTYGLIRPDLTQARRDQQIAVIDQIKAAIDRFKALKQDLSNATLRRKSADALAGMLRHREDRSEYAGLARQYIDPRLPKLKTFLEGKFRAELPTDEGHSADIAKAFVTAFGTPESQLTSDPGGFDL